MLTIYQCVAREAKWKILEIITIVKLFLNPTTTIRDTVRNIELNEYVNTVFKKAFLTPNLHPTF